LKFVLILILALVLALAPTPIPTTCASSGAEGAGADDGPGSKEYEVYSALMEEVVAAEKRSGPVAIRDRAGCPKFVVEMASSGIDAVKPENWEDFKVKNAQEYPLEERFNLSVGYDLVNERDDPETKGILGLSRVGFDPEKSQALVHLDEIAAWYISNGRFVLFVKEDGRWRVEESTMTYFGE
jgi:hypothetical protein